MKSHSLRRIAYQFIEIQGVVEKFLDHLLHTWLVLRTTGRQERTCGRVEIDKNEKLGMEGLVRAVA